MSTATQPLSGTYAADNDHSSFQFAVKHMKVATFRAGFGDVEASLVAGDDGLRLEGRAKVASVDVVKPPELRAHLVDSPEFFDGANHPEITFVSDDIDLREDGTAVVNGELTIKGITKPLEATGTWQEPIDDPYGMTRTALTLTATLDRREFGLDWQAPLPNGDDVLAWDVALTAELELILQG